VTATPLERSYRRLLLAYPGAYRHRHGTEILTTLMEMAGPEQRRPHRAEVWHLIAGGIRQRFRLPGRRPAAVVGAVLATLIVGGFGAAAGSWLGWQAAADLPDERAIATTARVLGDVGAGPEGPDHIAGSPWSLASGWSRVVNSRHLTVEQMDAALTADGWRQVRPVEKLDMPVQARVHGELVPAQFDWFVSVKDGVRLSLSALTTPDTSPAATDAQLTFSAVEPSAVRPLVIAGAVLGGLLGWMVAAAAAQRSRGRRAPGLLAFGALTLLAPPALAIAGNVARTLLTPGGSGMIEPAVHAAFTPGPYYPYGPGWLVLALSVAGGVLALVGGVVAGRGRPEAARPAGQAA
jgi:hypothetical protein